MLHLITGGSGSGKSAYAENYLAGLGAGERVYIATMYPFDEESRRRIIRHQQMRREKNFRTIECYTNLAEVILPAPALVLLECLSNLTANEMYRPDGAGEDTVKAVLDGIDKLLEQAVKLTVVTNEVFSDGRGYDQETERYQSFLGSINRQLAQRADYVTEVVYGIPIRIKGAKDETVT